MSAVPDFGTDEFGVGRSIFLCDLDDDVRSRLESALVDLGHRATLCASLAHALSLIKGSDVVFLSDRVTGTGISAIRERSETIPLIFLLSGSDEQAICQAYQDGADMVLVQPVLAQHLGFLLRTSDRWHERYRSGLSLTNRAVDER